MTGPWALGGLLAASVALLLLVVCGGSAASEPSPTDFEELKAKTSGVPCHRFLHTESLIQAHRGQLVYCQGTVYRFSGSKEGFYSFRLSTGAVSTATGLHIDYQGVPVANRAKVELVGIVIGPTSEKRFIGTRAVIQAIQVRMDSQ